MRLCTRYFVLATVCCSFLSVSVSLSLIVKIPFLLCSQTRTDDTSSASTVASVSNFVTKKDLATRFDQNMELYYVILPRKSFLFAFLVCPLCLLCLVLVMF